MKHEHVGGAGPPKTNARLGEPGARKSIQNSKSHENARAGGDAQGGEPRGETALRTVLILRLRIQWLEVAGFQASITRLGEALHAGRIKPRAAAQLVARYQEWLDDAPDR